MGGKNGNSQNKKFMEGTFLGQLIIDISHLYLFNSLYVIGVEYTPQSELLQSLKNLHAVASNYLGKKFSI